jgi:regulator of sigma E protease
VIIVLGVLAAVLGVSLLIVIHEAGHFLVARAFGMKVERFSVGFGKVLFSVKRGGTEFAVSALPLGGYVKIVGMAPGEDVDPADPTLYANQAAWRRFLAILAGPGMNYLSALLLAALLLSGPGLLMPDPAAAVGRVEKDSPAERAGLRNGDRVLSMAARPVATWDDLLAVIQSHPGQEIPVVVERGEGASAERVTLQLTPRLESGVGRAGFRPHLLPVTAPGAAALREALHQTDEFAGLQLSAFGKLFSGGKGTKVGGPVAIVQESLLAFQEGGVAFANFLWKISVVLAVLNLLPFPGLDGSRLVFLAYEVVSRRRVNARVENAIHAVGMVALFALLIGVTLLADLGLGEKLRQLLRL